MTKLMLLILIVGYQAFAIIANAHDITENDYTIDCDAPQAYEDQDYEALCQEQSSDDTDDLGETEILGEV